jgi:hypothetical protein
MDHVVLGEDFGDLGLQRTQFVDAVQVVDLERLDGATAAFWRIRRSRTRMVPDSASAANSPAISPLKFD